MHFSSFYTRLISLFLLTFSSVFAFAQQPASYLSRGVGGGGAFFAPCFHPVNSLEFTVSSDMSGVYNTKNQGSSYTLISHKQLQGGCFSYMRFTNTTSLRFAINYKMAGNLAQYNIAKSTDTGNTWLNLNTGLDPNNPLYSLFVDYNAPTRIIVSDYTTIYYSVNGGVTFNPIYTTANTSGGCIVSAALFNGNAIYIGTSDGLLASTDNGANFAIETHTGIPTGQAILSFCFAKVSGIIRAFCLTANASDLYVGINTDGKSYRNIAKGVYKLDYSATAPWTSIVTGLNFATDFPMHIACAENDLNYCWLAGGSSVGEPRVWKTTNAGTSWTNTFKTTNNQNITSGWCGSGGERGWTYGECATGLAVAGRDKFNVVFTDLGFIHSTTTAGSSWEQIYVTPDNLHVSGLTTARGLPYVSVGLENTTCWQVWWTSAQNLFAAFSDIKATRSENGGEQWSFNYKGLYTSNSTYRFAKSTNGTVQYAATSGIHDLYQSTRLQDAQLNTADTSGKILFSLDNGARWQLMHNFGHPVFWIANDPTNAERLYASVVHSTDGGVFMTSNRSAGASSVWTKLPNPPRTEGHPASLIVLNDGSLVATYSARRTAAGAFTASSGCFLYNPTTGTWADRTDAAMQYWCKDVVIDPADASQNTWFVCVFSGWGGAPNNKGGLYKTTNRGITWTRVWNSDRVSSITFHPQNSDIAYLTTETEGLWLTSNINAATPTFVQTNYPFRQPERVFFNPYTLGQLWITSFGAGLRKADNVLVATDEVQTFATPIRCFPNPATDICMVELPIENEKMATIKVFNTDGKLMEQYTTTKATFQFNTTIWQAGVYFIEIMVENKRFQTRMLKL